MAKPVSATKGLRACLAAFALALGLVMLGPSSDAHAGGGRAGDQAFGPCIPEICEFVRQIGEAARESFVDATINAIPNPEHIREQIQSCLDGLLNVGLDLIMSFSWPNIFAIINSVISDLINKICEKVTTFWDGILENLRFNFTLPNIPIEIMGQQYPGFGGQIGGGFQRGGNIAPGLNIELETPAGTQTLQGPLFNAN